MKKKLFLVFLAIILLIQLRSQEGKNLKTYNLLFYKAESLFKNSISDYTDSVALSYFEKVTAKLNPSPETALLLYNSYERSGILKQGLYFSSQQIFSDYYQALLLKSTYHLDDSIMFRLLLSLGNLHYADGRFDSSVYYFSAAENIIDRYPKAGLAGDLYNSLGALYSEAGNYLQSGNYFNKALEITKQTRPDLKEAVFAMSVNIASAVRLSGQTDSALGLYKKLLKPSNPSLPVLNNIAEIYLAKKQPDSALHYLKTTKKIAGSYALIFYNSRARAFMMKQDIPRASACLDSAVITYSKTKPRKKNNIYGATCQYTGDLMMLKNKPMLAINFYQQAIIQLDYRFNDKNIFNNPGNFINEFASYDLFDALAAKAICFSVLYNQTKNKRYFNAAVISYDSAFALSDYIKKSIDNDEARLFVADKVFTTYIKAIDFLMADNVRNNNTIKALTWISKSKATSLSISLKENTIKKYSGLPDSLIQKEKNLKISISRLKLQLQLVEKREEQLQFLSDINTATLQLQSVNNEFKKYPQYYKEIFSADSVNIKLIQANILTSSTAVICFFRGENVFYAFVITKNNISSYQIKADISLEDNISKFISGVETNILGIVYNALPAKYLYKHLFQPMIKDLKESKSLVIIPDRELINVPFEAFEDADNNYLIEKFPVTYQYALPFMQRSAAKFVIKNALAFAPFAENGNTKFAALPSSAEETFGFSAKQKFVNSAATKAKFISAAANASVMHLATHAAVNFIEPANSYIAFYGSDTSNKVYAYELYNLQMPETQLVFLSACETGSGKLSQSEGALSISRAFAYAGCSNIITSLWKAEDAATAYISKKFYYYTSKGDTYTRALQKAKSDLLHDASMSQFHLPQYWSHLILIGNIQEEQSFGYVVIIVSVVLLLAVMLLIRKFILRNKKVN